jgi:hypothetical protein
MKPTKTLFTILVYLLPLSLSAGELDGKNLICEQDGEFYYGVRFVNGKAVMNSFYSYWRKQSEVTINTSYDPDSYSAQANFVVWGYFRLDRKTLSLQKSTGYTEETKYQCRLAAEDDYYKEIEKVRAKRQQQVDGAMKGNRI